MKALILAAVLASHYSGEISIGGGYPIEVDFQAKTITPIRQKAQKIERIVVDGNRVSFEWPEEGDALAKFDGSVAGDQISGSFEQGTTRATFWLTRTAAVAPETFDALRGLYRDGSKLVWIGRMSELRRQPALIEPESGRFAVLYHASATSWFTRDGSRIDFDELARIDCCVEEEVSWTNGAVTLSGTLVKPRNAGGPVPAVVMLHGSGGATRAYFSSLPYLLAHHGIAALTYDKRGSGKSTGNRHTATFYDLADDATLGAKMLVARGDIDPERIGLFGHSQGGWIAPLAAHRWPGFRFAVSSAGPAVSVDDEIRNEKLAALRAGNASENDVRMTMRALDLYFDVRRRRATWAELAKAIEEAKGTTYDRYIFHPKSEAEVLADLEEYDPAPVLSSLRVPLLAMYAEHDPAVTPAINVPRMKRYLALAGNRRSTVRVFDGADHDFIVGRRRYADGYLPFVVSWIARTIAEEEPNMAKGNNARKKETKKPKKDKK